MDHENKAPEVWCYRIDKAQQAVCCVSPVDTIACLGYHPVSATTICPLGGEECGTIPEAAAMGGGVDKGNRQDDGWVNCRNSRE